MAEAHDIDVDNIIEQLLTVRGSKPGRQVNLPEAEIRWLCIKSREIFTVQPVLLELEAPIKICGKNHDFPDLPLKCSVLLSIDIHSISFHNSFSILLLRWYSRSVLRSPTTFRIWWISAHSELSVLRVRSHCLSYHVSWRFLCLLCVLYK